MNNIKFGDEKKKGSFFLQIKHDFYKGTIEGWKRYAIALCIFVFLCFVFQIRAEKIIQFNKISKEISFSDFILFMFRGMNVFDGNAVELQDKLPQWFLVNIYLSIIIGYFPLKDLSESGIQVLIRTKSRVSWWLSKCLWVTYNVLIYYAISIIVITVFSLFHGGLSLEPSKELNLILSNLDTSKFNFKGILIVGIILPVITSITFSLIQLLISLFTNSIISNMFIITVLTLTPFYCNSFFIGNYLMILRSNLNIGDSGISIVYGIVVCVVLSIATIFIGANKIKRYDILEK
ncbi:hypothetical protein IO99_05390 [Clostridium sulfidigenes]|uniref:Uncharacterized protein n=1 Tax=Clostridium sulfidigenes TaxID=318464 RepID=A0A084JEX7_9CLOT|nr:hypothetical protein [Clostridium sulfidigenes]KEZ87511.1 hypothetical protein IO99_05390 [Clostridium sulfidigenes]